MCKIEQYAYESVWCDYIVLCLFLLRNKINDHVRNSGTDQMKKYIRNANMNFMYFFSYFLSNFILTLALFYITIIIR